MLILDVLQLGAPTMAWSDQNTGADSRYVKHDGHVDS